MYHCEPHTYIPVISVDKPLMHEILINNLMNIYVTILIVPFHHQLVVAMDINTIKSL